MPQFCLPWQWTPRNTPEHRSMALQGAGAFQAVQACGLRVQGRVVVLGWTTRIAHCMPEWTDLETKKRSEANPWETSDLMQI